MQQTLRHALNWFEMPVRDMRRAQSFYETLLGAPMKRDVMGQQTMAIFSADATGVGGCLVSGEGMPAPGTTGTLVYLNAEPSLDAVLARVKTAGGEITTAKVRLPGEMGVFAHITDTQGNRVGLHALS